jgi:hypothetical protein
MFLDLISSGEEAFKLNAQASQILVLRGNVLDAPTISGGVL